MPSSCCVPECSHHTLAASMGISFHKFPRDNDRRRKWLVAIRNANLSVNATWESLKSHRVCSRHFKPSDFKRDFAHELTGSKKLNLLNDDAVPSSFSWPSRHSPPPRPAFVKRQRMAAAAAQGVPIRQEHDDPMPAVEPVPEAVFVQPQQHTPERPLMAPPQQFSSPRPDASSPMSSPVSVMQQASSGSEYQPTPGSDTDGDSDDSYYSDGDDDPVIENCNHRVIADVDNILKLFKRCQECGEGIVPLLTRVGARGAQLNIHWECIKGHTGKWSSGAMLRKMAVNNLRVASAILLSGSTYRQTKKTFDFLNLQCIGRSTYDNIQKSYLLPVINEQYEEERRELLNELQGKENVSLLGDGRSDSPGYSAKYTTYTVMEETSKKIIDMELLQVTETTSSVAMEVEGFKRCLDRLVNNGVEVGTVTTDRSPSIRKVMREDHPDKDHQFDCWHVCKGTKKKVNTAGQKAQNRVLQQWVRSITNHLWYCSSDCDGDADELERMWLSLLRHIQGEHVWQDEDGTDRMCFHEPLTDEDQRLKIWLDEDSPAFRDLEKIVTNKQLLRDIRQMTLHKHTSILESYHSTMLKFAPKRLHFHYPAMQGRMQLAVLDHNHNVGRPQAKTRDGVDQYRFVASKQSGGQWTAKKKFVAKDYGYVFELIDKVLSRREDATVKYKSKESQLAIRPLPKNISKTPRPPTEEILAARK